MTPLEVIPSDVVQVVMVAGSFGAAVLAAWMGLRGKRGDQSIQQTQSQFDRMLGEVNYWKKEATDARAELEAFRDRQLSRCRNALDGATATITRMLRFVPDNLRRDAGRELDAIESHRTHDHDEDANPREDAP